MLNVDFVIVNIRFVEIDLEFECYFSKTMTLKENFDIFFELIEPNITQFYNIDKVLISDSENNFINKNILLNELGMTNGNLLKVY